MFKLYFSYKYLPFGIYFNLKYIFDFPVLHKNILNYYIILRDHDGELTTSRPTRYHADRVSKILIYMFKNKKCIAKL